jgi:hypothetical protein
LIRFQTRIGSFYELCKKLILAEDAVNSSVIFKELQDMLDSKKLSHASSRAMDYLCEVYRKNRKLLEKGFTLETNPVMEQLFSFINDFAFMCKSFRIEDGAYLVAQPARWEGLPTTLLHSGEVRCLYGEGYAASKYGLYKREITLEG